MTAHVLVVQAGSYSGPSELGDYGGWFADLVAEAGARPILWDARVAPPPPEDVDGLVVSGSAASSYDPDAWIARLRGHLIERIRAGVPVLGVCFGHQLIAEALGGNVERHPEGREVGTVPIELTEEGRQDLLFDGLPARFVANATHGDHVTRLPVDAIVLGRNDLVPVQAFGVGDSVRCVQFHPEFTGTAMRAYARKQADRLDQQAGPGAAARVAETATDTPEARSIVANFVHHFVRAHGDTR